MCSNNESAPSSSTPLAAVCVAGWGFFALRVLLPATLPFWLGLLIAAVLRPVTLLFSPPAALKAPPRRRLCHRAFFLHLLGLLLWLLLTLLWGQFCSIAARLPQLYKTVFLPRAGRFLRVAVGAAGPLCARPFRRGATVDAELCFRCRQALHLRFLGAAGCLHRHRRQDSAVVFDGGGHHLLLGVYLAGLPQGDAAAPAPHPPKAAAGPCAA